MFNGADYEATLKAEMASLAIGDMGNTNHRWGCFMMKQLSQREVSLNLFVARYPTPTEAQKRYIVEQRAQLAADLIRAQGYLHSHHTVENPRRAEAMVRLYERANKVEL